MSSSAAPKEQRIIKERYVLLPFFQLVVPGCPLPRPRLPLTCLFSLPTMYSMFYVSCAVCWLRLFTWD